jgi:hypothetical protein
MWVVFQKSDKKIVGASASSPQPIPKEQALQEVVRGMGEGHDVNNFDAVEVNDHAKVGSMLRAIGEGKARVQDVAQGIANLVDETAAGASLAVTVEGNVDIHAVDQVPLMQATPTAFVTIRVQKVDAQGKPLTRKTIDKEVLWLRTDAGFLRANTGTPPAGTLSGAGGGDVLVGAGPSEIRSVTLVSGTASFRLYAEPAKRLATVQILHQDPSLRATVRVEFI